MPVAPGWLSLGTVPFCYAVPFGPVNSATHNGLLILFERVGGKTAPTYKSAVRLDQPEQRLPDSLQLLPSRLPQLATSGTAWPARQRVPAVVIGGSVGKASTTGVIPGRSSNRHHFKSLHSPPVYLGHIWYYSSTEYLHNPLKQHWLSQLVFTSSGTYFHFTKYIRFHINSAVFELLAAKPEHSLQGCHHHGIPKYPRGGEERAAGPPQPGRAAMVSQLVGRSARVPPGRREASQQSVPYRPLQMYIKLSLQTPHSQNNLIKSILLYNVKSRAHFGEGTGKGYNAHS